MRRRLGDALVLVCALGSWWALALVHVGGRQLLASPWQTLAALPDSTSELGVDLLATLARSASGLLIGALLGLAVGLAAARLLPHAPVIEALLDVARSIPPVVLLPVFLLGLGFNDLARVATVSAGCLWTMALAVTTAARAPKSGRRELLELAGASRSDTLAWTQPWESLGTLVVGFRTAASMAVIIAVVTEMVVGAEHGIGAHVVSAQVSGNVSALTLDIVAIALVGWLINRMLRALEVWARAVAG